jgi:hypothetical protein
MASTWIISRVFITHTAPNQEAKLRVVDREVTSYLGRKRREQVAVDMCHHVHEKHYGEHDD